ISCAIDLEVTRPGYPYSAATHFGGVTSCTKAQEYLTKGCHVFLANITATKDGDKSKKKRLEDVPVVQEFPEVFPEDLPGIPPTTRQVYFRIDGTLGGVLSLRGNVKINSGRNIHTSSSRLHRHQVHLTGEDYNTSYFRSLYDVM
ncbi:hypothetical protein Tco_0358578, partial [Tanacetum coccineum]